jgi:hypothetical protein
LTAIIMATVVVVVAALLAQVLWVGAGTSWRNKSSFCPQMTKRRWSLTGIHGEQWPTGGSLPDADNVDLAVIGSYDAFTRIVFGSGVTFGKKLKAPVFKCHTTLFIVVEIPTFRLAYSFKASSQFISEVVKLHCYTKGPTGV